MEQLELNPTSLLVRQLVDPTSLILRLVEKSPKLELARHPWLPVEYPKSLILQQEGWVLSSPCASHLCVQLMLRDLLCYLLCLDLYHGRDLLCPQNHPGRRASLCSDL